MVHQVNVLNNEEPLKENDSHNVVKYKGTKRLTAHNIDRLSRFVFPLLLLIFNVVYWTYYSRGIIF